MPSFSVCGCARNLKERTDISSEEAFGDAKFKTVHPTRRGTYAVMGDGFGDEFGGFPMFEAQDGREALPPHLASSPCMTCLLCCGLVLLCTVGTYLVYLTETGDVPDPSAFFLKNLGSESETTVAPIASPRIAMDALGVVTTAAPETPPRADTDARLRLKTSPRADSRKAESVLSGPLYFCSYPEDVTQWSAPKRSWCCSYEGAGCETSTTTVSTTTVSTTTVTWEYACELGERSLWPREKVWYCCERAGSGCMATEALAK